MKISRGDASREKQSELNATETEKEKVEKQKIFRIKRREKRGRKFLNQIERF